jgi:hypothetical protein
MTWIVYPLAAALLLAIGYRFGRARKTYDVIQEDVRARAEQADNDAEVTDLVDAARTGLYVIDRAIASEADPGVHALRARYLLSTALLAWPTPSSTAPERR